MTGGGVPREIHIRLPKDVMESLRKGVQSNISFQTDELGFPLRIIIWAADPAPVKPRFRHKHSSKKKEEDDDS